ncbi:NADP-dependent oxidoreductase domain-containing protein [Cantharellus anzutake]|uniref:NADP-dependent oxidoreductase domain-containing protein n=1 Tax=Cantharellus anzutake TaxID=1750568 RepID=UPI0019062ECD|nr:NADP-dependent oxidoreductase domain-containing protein [Cantharellus anzutake]KAF8336961.1 NADP-dependent oxidoreductase domain-containing protein [Cantharellus anzutake]
MVDESLKKLGFEYIDLYLIHDPYPGKTKSLGTHRPLLAAQKSGKIRSVGVSNQYGVHHLEEIRNEGLPAPSVNQIELHPFGQQKLIVEYCAVNGIAGEAYSPLVRGVARDQTVLQVVNEVGKSPFLVYIRWSLQRGFIPLLKSATPFRIVENASVSNFQLSEEQMAALNALDKGRDGAVTWNPVDAP